MFDWVLNTPLSGIFNLPWTKRFAIALMVKSSNQLNCQNDLSSPGMQVRYLWRNTYKCFNMEVPHQRNNLKHEYVNVHH